MAQICTNLGCPDNQRALVIQDPNLMFCPTCGNRLQLAGPGVGPIPLIPVAIQPASKGKRIGAWAIDWLIVSMIGIVAVFVGTLAGLAAVAYWLFRDINGASPGKSVVGLVVVSRSGAESTQMQRIMRNLTFAIPVLPLVVPFVGAAVAVPLSGIVFIVEGIMVLTSGERIGDKIGGTLVAERGR